jgi:N-acetylglucosamine malate deacetylase 2
MRFEDVKRVLVFVAHPDDESIGCGALLQRVPSALVVFAVDGAPAGYGFERKFGSLKNYSEQRFKEAGRALGLVPNCSFRRLKTRDGAYFPDRHLFENLKEAASSLVAIAQEFSPDAIFTHAYEGGHIDHDACSFLTNQVASVLSLTCFEFPLYWKDGRGLDVFQEFRNAQEGATFLNLSEAEIAIKKQMLAEYETQREIVGIFSSKVEKFRPAPSHLYARPSWNSYPPGNWRGRRDAKAVLRGFSQFPAIASR